MNKEKMKWILIKDELPKKNGWFFCTVSEDIGGYARELYFKNGCFLDNIRIEMFELYNISSKLTGEQIIDDGSSTDWTDMVVAWMALPEPYKEEK